MSTTLQFSGEQTDALTGLQYLRARYYDAATGRFTRMDPWAGNNRDPKSLHKYMYCHGDPVNGVDPTGMFTFGGMSTGLAWYAGINASIAGTMGFIQHGLRGLLGGIVGSVWTTYTSAYLTFQTGFVSAPIAFAVGAFSGKIIELGIVHGGDYFKSVRPWFNASISAAVAGVMGWAGSAALKKVSTDISNSIVGQLGWREIARRMNADRIIMKSQASMYKTVARNPEAIRVAFAKLFRATTWNTVASAIRSVATGNAEGKAADWASDLVDMIGDAFESLLNFKHPADAVMEDG